MEIKAEKIQGITYYTGEARGVLYTLRFVNGQWELHSNRKALSNNIGTYKFFKNLQELENKIKAFVGVSQLIEEPTML